ncbi:DUF397 domain-containing protein [Streptomyces sp. H27-S2]|uniref:DUF397 domain-containing protein n=1 Tax=Streptomyces antarcticus TaxID=2996458 RepID=UPI00226F8DAF|nr:DUF397 domain-containing protein [Streptomyces sp. H27-S2]MCY0953952.1 DUF397 domain-containing protein [Streptomyces sp. H27-S2]
MPEFQCKESTQGGQDMNECVEVAANAAGTDGVRDGKRADGAVIRVTEAAWTAFAVAGR